MQKMQTLEHTGVGTGAGIGRAAVRVAAMSTLDKVVNFMVWAVNYTTSNLILRKSTTTTSSARFFNRMGHLRPLNN